jgi:hypothetical protein
MTPVSSKKKANERGRAFEQHTDFIFMERLFGFDRHFLPSSGENSFVLKKKEGTKTIYGMKQRAFGIFVRHMAGIESHLIPDESYFIFHSSATGPSTLVLKIIEKKAQHVDGSVEEKLLCGPSYKEEYKQLFALAQLDIHVEYAYCVNEFLAKKLASATPKYKIRDAIRRAHGIEWFDGSSPDYPTKLYQWILKDPDL